MRVESIEAWIQWLKEHHHKGKIAWLVFKKKGKGPAPFDYHMSLDPALCFGRVDSLLKSIDDQDTCGILHPAKPQVLGRILTSRSWKC